MRTASSSRRNGEETVSIGKENSGNDNEVTTEVVVREEHGTIEGGVDKIARRNDGDGVATEEMALLRGVPPGHAVPLPRLEGAH